MKYLRAVPGYKGTDHEWNTRIRKKLNVFSLNSKTQNYRKERIEDY
jgi:hypothetical protein